MVKTIAEKTGWEEKFNGRKELRGRARGVFEERVVKIRKKLV
jgi:hypothetical protein